MYFNVDLYMFGCVPLCILKAVFPHNDIAGWTLLKQGNIDEGISLVKTEVVQ